MNAKPTSSSRSVSIICFCALVSLLVLLGESVVLAYVPWDSLVSDNWVWTEANPDGIPQVNLYTVNGGYNNGVYPILFEPKRNDGGARGMKALKFQYGGANTGHLASSNLTDSFDILNTGNNNIFDYVILGISIKATSLPDSFSLSLNASASGGNTWATSGLDDFVYYDATGNHTGRPTGYYSQTNPASSPLAYDVSAGMTCLVDTGVVLNPSGGSATISYSFANLPGPAVFSLYGFISSEDPLGMHHTNRGITDNNDPGAALSTFEVHLPGDVNDDGYVGGLDLTTIITNWGTTAATRGQGDLDGDGTVSGPDYTQAITFWGTGTPPEPPSTIPEPATAITLFSATVFLLARPKFRRTNRKAYG